MNPIPFLRKVALAEAVSFLVLLGIAMPLKYMAHLPIAVKVAGSVHGLLFVLFCIALWRAWLGARWPLSRAATLFVAALLPFGPFVIDGRMRVWEAEFGSGAAQ